MHLKELHSLYPPAAKLHSAINSLNTSHLNKIHPWMDKSCSVMWPTLWQWETLLWGINFNCFLFFPVHSENHQDLSRKPSLQLHLMNSNKSTGFSKFHSCPSVQKALEVTMGRKQKTRDFVHNYCYCIAMLLSSIVFIVLVLKLCIFYVQE